MDREGSIFIVEDHQSMRETLEIFFTRKGWGVHSCPNGKEAIAKLKSSPPFDLVITDLVMPGAVGREVLRVVRKLDPTTQGIVI
ncbi:MAG: response regulator, partial [Pseudomonadota bacterium]